MILPKVEPGPDATGVHAVRRLYRNAVVFVVHMLSGVDVAAVIYKMDLIYRRGRFAGSFGFKLLGEFRKGRDGRIGLTENRARQSQTPCRFRP
jgi:hypothetical protein